MGRARRAFGVPSGRKPPKHAPRGVTEGGQFIGSSSVLHAVIRALLAGKKPERREEIERHLTDMPRRRLLDTARTHGVSVRRGKPNPDVAAALTRPRGGTAPAPARSVRGVGPERHRTMTAADARARVAAEEAREVRALGAEHGYTDGYARDMGERIAAREIPDGSRVVTAGDHMVIARSGSYAPGAELGAFTPAEHRVDDEVLTQAARELDALSAANPVPHPIRVMFTGQRSSVGRAAGGGDGRTISMHLDWAAGTPMDSGTGFASWFMPAAGRPDVTELRYHLAHEYGHSLAGQHQHEHASIHGGQREHLSPYGQSDHREGYAEAFAEWWLSGGTTDNPGVRAYAERYGWKAPEGTGAPVTHRPISGPVHASAETQAHTDAYQRGEIDAGELARRMQGMGADRRESPRPSPSSPDAVAAEVAAQRGAGAAHQRRMADMMQAHREATGTPAAPARRARATRPRPPTAPAVRAHLLTLRTNEERREYLAGLGLTRAQANTLARGLGARETRISADATLDNIVRHFDVPREERRDGLTGDAALAAAPVDFTRPREAGLTPEEEAVLEDYVGDGAYGTNPALREYRGRTDPHDDDTVERVRHMDAVMARSPLTADVTVERGISYGDAVEVFGGEDRWRGDLTGATVLDHGYMSTTARPGGGTQYAKQGDEGRPTSSQATIRLHVPVGTHAIKMSGSEYEDELLLERGLTIRVISDSGYSESGGRRIEAEIVPGKVDAPAMMTGAEFDALTPEQQRQRMRDAGYDDRLIEFVMGRTSDPEQDGRDEQADIDAARPYAEVAGELDELIHHEATDRALMSRFDAALARHRIDSDPEMLRVSLLLDSGDREAAWEAMSDALRGRGITPNGRAGDVTDFDPHAHTPIAGHYREGELGRVQVTRPGFTLERNGRRISLRRPTVEAADAPAPTPAPRTARARMSGQLTTEQHVAALEAMQTREEATTYLEDVRGRALTDLARHYHANFGRTVADRRRMIVDATVGRRLHGAAIAEMGRDMGRSVREEMERGAADAARREGLTATPAVPRAARRGSDGLSRLRDDQLRSLATEYEVPGSWRKSRPSLLAALRTRGAVAPAVARERAQAARAGTPADRVSGRRASAGLRISLALQKWSNGDGPDEPLVGAFTREELRREAIARGITVRRGATDREIADALKAETREQFRQRERGRTDLRSPGDLMDPAHTTDDEVRAVFEGNFGGMTTRVTTQPWQGSAISRSRNGGLHVAGTVYDSSGREVGRFVRRYSRDRDGNLIAHHELLSIQSQVQGSGFSNAFNGHLIRWYRQNGVKEVRVHANIDVGGYAWARLGYDFADTESAEHILGVLRREVERLERRPSSNPRVVEGLRQARELLARAASHRFGEPGYPTPYEISQLGRWDGAGKLDKWIGKKILLGSDWYGVLRL